MGQMIIPEFQIFGEFLPLKQLSGTRAGYKLLVLDFRGGGTIMPPLASPLSTSPCNFQSQSKRQI